MPFSKVMKELRKNLLLMSNGVSTGGIMLKVKVTSKGQVTLFPKPIIDELKKLGYDRLNAYLR